MLVLSLCSSLSFLDWCFFYSIYLLILPFVHSTRFFPSMSIWHQGVNMPLISMMCIVLEGCLTCLCHCTCVYWMNVNWFTWHEFFEKYSFDISMSKILRMSIQHLKTYLRCWCQCACWCWMNTLFIWHGFFFPCSFNMCS